MNTIEQKKKALLQALKKSLGVVSTACDAVGIGRTSFYNYVNDDPEFAKAVEELDETALDFAESKLFEKIEGVVVQSRDGETVYKLPPDTTSIIFYLKTKGKKRGYVERQEVVNPHPTTIVFEDARTDKAKKKVESIPKIEEDELELR